METLKTQHRTVALYLAMGSSLVDVCEVLGLKYETWRQIEKAPLFIEEVKRIQEKREEELLDKAEEDPIYLKLKLATNRAASMLVSEIENLDSETGGTAGTRIKAAESILDRTGYGKKQDEEIGRILMINLSEEKAAQVLGLGKTALADVPHSIKEGVANAAPA